MTNDKAVLWDMDGVLVDTFDGHFHAWKQTFDEMEHPFTLEDFRTCTRSALMKRGRAETIVEEVATAVRRVAGLAPTSTIWAWPWASKWVSGEEGVVMAGGFTKGRETFSRPGHHTAMTRRPVRFSRQGSGVRSIKQKKPFALAGRALAAAVLIAFGAGQTPMAIAQSALPMMGDGAEMTTSAERKLGDRIIRELYRDQDYIDDAVLQEYVQNLFQSLVRAAEQRGELSPELQERFAWQILLGRDRTVNAFALPGGYLGVHLGLGGVVSSRDELASWLRRFRRHGRQGLKTTKTQELR